MKSKLTSVGAVLVMVISHQVAWSDETPPFVLKDSKIPAKLMQPIYWLDNERVIFTGYELNLDKLDKQGKYERQQNIFIWDTRINRTETFAKDAVLGCYFQGYIRYSVGREGKKGMLGQERTYVTWTEDKKYTYSQETWEGEPQDSEGQQHVRAHPITCKSFKSKGLLADYVELLPEHGYLSFKVSPLEPPPGPLMPIIWYRPGVSEGIKLPLAKGQVNPGLVYYIEFLNEYLLYSHNYFDPPSGRSSAEWPKGLPKIYWLMKPDGTVSQHEIRQIYGNWHHVRPLRHGVFGFGGVSGAAAVHRTAGNAGAYWIEGNRQYRLSEGLVQTMAVSPNGCKVAFVNEPHDGLPIHDRLTVRVLDVCMGE